MEEEDEIRFAYGESFANVRRLVEFINDKHIKQENIVSVLNVNTEVFLIYFM